MSLPLSPAAVGSIVFCYGLLFGSFLNVVIHRLPDPEQSIVRPRSRCPACGASIPWYRNLPVVSWLALRGRCADCRAPISVRYPLIELATGLVLVLVWLRFGIALPFFLYASYALALVALFGIDLERYLLPDAITLPGTALGLAVSPWNPHVTWKTALIGAAAGYGVLWLLDETYYRLRGESGLGGGDLKLAAMIGAWSGWKGLLEVLLLASFGGVLVGLGLVVSRRANLRTALPFGCFLAPAALVVGLAGGEVLWLGWQGVMDRLWDRLGSGGGGV